MCVLLLLIILFGCMIYALYVLARALVRGDSLPMMVEALWWRVGLAVVIFLIVGLTSLGSVYRVGIPL